MTSTTATTRGLINSHDVRFLRCCRRSMSLEEVDSEVGTSSAEANAVVRSLRQLPDFSLHGGAESLTEGRTALRTVVPSPTAEDDGVNLTKPPQDPSDFLWLMTEEPHRSRRMAIMKKHPEVRFRSVPGCSLLSFTCRLRNSWATSPSQNGSSLV